MYGGRKTIINLKNVIIINSMYKDINGYGFR